ncbi:MAG TPA: HEAT repeat domain-containing protein [Gemmataceae bacterium]|nr:HEAT repeat domain-containing protein [Gemmataceae bacterium]
MKQLLCGGLLAFLLCGCGKEQPTLSGGKPVSHWLAEAKGPDARARKRAVFKLGNVGPADVAAFPAVLAALADQDPSVRCEAIRAVVKFGPKGQVAQSKLAEMRQNDDDEQVRDFAGKALDKLKEIPTGG